MFTYDFIECPKEPENMVEFFANELFPLIDKYWNSIGKEETGYELALDVPSLANLWTTHRLVVFMAYEGDKPVGYALCFAMRPLWYEARLLQVEQYYLPSAEMESGMFKYIDGVVKFLECSEVHLKPHNASDPNLSGRVEAQEWKRYVR